MISLIRKCNPILLIIFIGIITYLPSLFGQMFWDDDDFILNNIYVKEFQIGKLFTTQAVEGAGKPSNYYRPIQFTLYSILYQFFGPRPLPYKILNISIHIFATIFIAIFFKSVFTKKNNLLYSQLIAIIFLIHPIQSESVSYVSGMSDPLVALFGFLTLNSFFKYKALQLPIISFGFYILCLLSKESGVIFSGIIFLLWILKLSNHKNIKITLVKSFILQIIPFICISLIYLWYHQNIIQIVDLKSAWGNIPYTNSVLIRVVTFLGFFPQYIIALLFPLHLFYDRDFSVEILKTVWSFPGFFTLITLCTITVLVLINAVRTKNWLAIMLYFGFYISLSPFTGLILINGIMYEHYLYIPLIFFFGFLLLVFQPFKHATTQSLILILLCMFIARSWIRQHQWNDPVRLYTHSLLYVPNSFRVRNNLGSEYQRRSQIDLAIAEYKKAIELNPRIPNPYHNLGNLYLLEGDKTNAIFYFQKALEVDPNFFYSKKKLEDLYK